MSIDRNAFRSFSNATIAGLIAGVRIRWGQERIESRLDPTFCAVAYQSARSESNNNGHSKKEIAMKEKSHTKESTYQKSKPLSEAADRAMKNYEHAVRTGLKLQEEAAHLWTNFLTHNTSPQDWQNRFSGATELANGILPATQKRMEDLLDLMEQNTKASTELFKKAADVCQTTTVPECQAKWMDFCTASVDLARSNFEAITQINSRAIDSWINYVRKRGDVTEAHTSRAA